MIVTLTHPLTQVVLTTPSLTVGLLPRRQLLARSRGGTDSTAEVAGRPKLQVELSWSGSATPCRERRSLAVKLAEYPPVSSPAAATQSASAYSSADCRA